MVNSSMGGGFDTRVCCEGYRQAAPALKSELLSDPEGVAEGARLVIQTGLAGFSLEDRDVGRGGRLHDKAAALERLRAARETIDRSGVKRAARCAHGDRAGRAGCEDNIRAIVQAVALKPVNVLVIGSKHNACRVRGAW